MSIWIVISSEQEKLWICLWSDCECTPSNILNNPIISWFDEVMCSDIKIISKSSSIVIWAEDEMIWMSSWFDSVNSTIYVFQQEVSILRRIVSNSNIKVISKGSRLVCSCSQESWWDCEWSDGYYDWELRILHLIIISE